MEGAVFVIVIIAYAVAMYVNYMRRLKNSYPKIHKIPGGIYGRKKGFFGDASVAYKDFKKASPARIAWRIYIGGAALCLFVMMMHAGVLGEMGDDYALYEVFLASAIVSVLVLFLLILCGWAVRSTMEDGGWVDMWGFRFKVEGDEKHRSSKKG